MAIKILDLFAGVSGLSFGFELVRDSSDKPVFELHRAVEIDKYACETLRKRHGTEKVIEGDLTKPEIHEQVIRECKGEVLIVVGGIPCQSFSLLGPRSGYGKQMEQFKQDRRDHLHKEFTKIVSELKPHIVVIENVKGILSKKDPNGNKIIDNIISDLEGSGYNFEIDEGKKYHVLNAADFGVPQKRERVILIGILREWKDIKVPVIEPTHYDLNSKKEKSDKKLLPYVNLYEAIGDLPEVDPKTTKTGIPKNKWKIVNEHNKKVRNGLDNIIFDKSKFEEHISKISESGKQFLNFVRPNGYKYLDHHTARSQQLSDIELFKNMNEGETAGEFINRKPELASELIKYNMDTFKDKYRKQKWDQPSTTIFAHLEKDGNRFIHPKQARTITPREAARIQSFPDDFIVCGPASKKFKQIGNAVPPLMSYNIAQKIYSIMQVS
ncbi:MAG: DNA cytosine methyltransferase [Candidatus Methanoperedens sp.]|nr:DNA cytosine methyltransferase [Candidatus Methanoperedens sp.]